VRGGYLKREFSFSLRFGNG